MLGKKVGKCSVFDFNKKNLQNFKNKNYTDEEPSLKKHKFNHKRIKILQDENDLRNSKIIFLLMIHLLRKSDGYPITKSIQEKLKKLFKVKFKKKLKLLLLLNFILVTLIFEKNT